MRFNCIFITVILHTLIEGSRKGIIDELTGNEMINFEINYYTNLLRIKKSQPESCENSELNYQLKVQKNKLHTLGVNTDNFEID